MNEKAFTPTPEQKRATDPENSIWVAANAGSGKTHVLVERIIRLLLQGAEPASILCITYTKAAAAEMSARLFKRLGNWAAHDDQTLQIELQNLGVSEVDKFALSAARRLFTRALETPGGLKIQTIHAFCERLLHLFPVEAGLAPGFQVMDGRTSLQLRDEAVEKVMRASRLPAENELNVALNAIGDLTNSENFNNLIDEFLSGTKSWRSLLDTELEGGGFSLALKSTLQLMPEDSDQSITDQIENIDVESYRRHAMILKPFGPHRNHNTSELMLKAATSGDRLLILKQLFFTADVSKFRDSLIAKKTSQAHLEIDNFLNSEKARLSTLFEKLWLIERVEATSHLFTLAKAIHRETESKKKLKGLYDFDDLIERCEKLLGNAKATHWVLHKLDSGLKHILVDEAQDTSPSQWQIVKALADEFYSGESPNNKFDRTLFVVGDRKQSIFSFQGADVSAFALARKSFSEKIAGSGAKLDLIDLSISYRSTPEVLQAIDQVFPPSTPHLLGFSSDNFVERGHTTIRNSEPGVVEVWPLYEPLEKEEEEPWIAPIDREPAASPRRRLARDIVATIKSWIDHRYLPSKNRTVRPDDVLILLQSRGPLFAMLIAELRRAHIPVAGADRLKLLESLAVKDLLALLQWLMLPEDDYSLACILKSPLLPQPYSEDQLFELCHGRATDTLWSRVEARADENTKRLLIWKTQSETSGPFELLAQVMVKTRKAMVARLGAEAEDAANALLDQALAYEFEFGPYLAGFLHWIMAQETDVKREMEKDSGEVRLMTIHGAKGLEANIVFVADAGSMPKSNRTTPNLLEVIGLNQSYSLPLWRSTGKEKSAKQTALEVVEEQRVKAERNRLLYVAMTRACDELYICGVGSKGKSDNGSWYEIISKALVESENEDGVRIGSEPQYRDTEKKLAIDNVELPHWIKSPAPIEDNAQLYSLTGLVTRHLKKQKNYDLAAAKRGVAIHTLLEGLPNISGEKREIYAKRKARDLGLDEKEAIILAKLFDHPELEPFFGPESRSEAELRGTLENGQKVVGRVDRIAILSENIYLLDYKSDQFVPEALPIDHEYAQQMALYVQLLEEAYPSHQIIAALLWTQVAKVEWLSKAFLTQVRDQASTNLELEGS
jgi:ATP-dependent helicase/nuclease subunit A